MKKFHSIMVITLILAVMLPLTANAATITAAEKKGKSEATIGEIIDVVVKLDEKEAESMQFDLKYDNTKFKYVQESAQSDLNSTLSHEIEPGVVRVSVIDNNDDGKTDNEVSMKFEAIGEGKNAQFTVVEGSVEVGKASGKTVEKVKNPTATIATVFTNTGNGGEPAPAPAQQYVNDQGQVITSLPKTGEKEKANKILSINGTYSTLGSLQNVVPYAFQTSDVTLNLDSIKAEFGNNITTTVKGIAKTGDKITVDGTTYTIIIYGDVSGDGKVTTYDALLAKKIKSGKLTNVTEFQREAANIEKSAIDTTAMQKFILRLRKTATDTILDKFPTKPEAPISKVDAIEVQPSMAGGVRFDEILVATMKSATPGEDLIEGIIKNIVKDASGNDVSGMLKVVPNEIEAGVWNLVFTPTVAGTYTINPIIKIGNQTIVDEAHKALTVTVDEDYTVNDIEFYLDGKQLGNEISLREGKFIKPTIKYKHKYSDSVSIDINETNKAVTADNILFEINDANGVLDENATVLYDIKGANVQKDNNGNLINGGSHISEVAISAKSQMSGTATLTLGIQNTNIKKTITVNVEKPEAVGIKYNNNVYKNGDTASLDLYTYDPGNTEKVKTISTGEKGIFTIIDLDLINQFYESNPNSEDSYVTILGGNVDKKANTTTSTLDTIEISTTFDDDYIVVAKFTENGGVYTQTTSNTEIDAIGIAFVEELWDWDEDSLARIVSEGLKIEYAGTVAADGSVTKYVLNLQVSRQDAPVTVENIIDNDMAVAKAPAKLPEACVHEKDAGTETKSATCVEAGTITYKCTKCGEVVETTAIEALGHKYKDGKCTVCDAVENKDTNTTKPTTNTANKDNTAKPSTPTDIADGNKTPETPVVKPCEHQKDISSKYWIKEATCSEDGIRGYKCTNPNCDYVFEETIGKFGHDYENGKCTVCGEEELKEVVPTTPSEVETPAESVVPQDQTPETPAA